MDTIQPSRPCSFPGCPRSSRSRGWCNVHYERWRQHGDPAYPAQLSLEDRFWRHVDKTGECWIWTGTKSKHGYGMFSVSWDNSGRQRRTVAHRLAWILVHGPIDDATLEVAHNCPDGDDPACVRPSHMLLLTPEEHGKDRMRKRQMTMGDQHWTRLHPQDVPRGARSGARTHPEALLRGERHPNARLTDDMVREIRALYACGAVTQTALSERFGISAGAVAHVLKGRHWTHVT